jgi:hypothetical protein
VVKVYQTKVGDGGNCVAACYATLLGVGIDEIPDLCDTGNQHAAEVAMLAARGLGLVRVWLPRGGRTMEQALDGMMVSDGARYMMSGTSPRGLGHRVIGMDGALYHDPHPHGGGVRDVRSVLFIVSSVVFDMDGGREARQ